VFFQPATKQVNTVKSVPAPVGGLNARDSLAAMAETDAIVMQNWWPQPYGCSVRNGYREWATGMGAPVETIASLAQTNGNQKLYAWAGSSMWDVTTSGAVGAAALTGLTSPYWSWVCPANSAGSHLIAVNGQDDGIIVSGSGTINRIVAGDGIVANTWAGLNPVSAICVTVHQRRLWAVEKNTSFGWFLPPDAVQGTFKKVDFGPLFSRGGYLQALTTWTIDDGNGAEDHLVAVSSRGEVVVYGGTDPEDDTKWTLVGVYYVGAPVKGTRMYTKIGGDLALLTQQGVVSVASLLLSTKVNRPDDPILSNKIQFLISELTSSYADLDGWELRYFPRINMLLVSVPSVVAGGNIQLAANQLISSWTQFSGMDSACWWSLGNVPYFGDYNGRVLQAWTGNQDDVELDGTGGRGIVAQVQQAYSYFGNLATQKQIGMYRPTFIVNTPISLSTAIFYDYSTAQLTVPGDPPKDLNALWNYGIWNEAVWGGGSSVQKEWFQAAGLGVAASLAMTVQTGAEVLWVATDYSFVAGPGLL
jgi:hypothetical protein